MKTAQQFLATLAMAGTALALAAPAYAVDKLYDGANADDLAAWNAAMATRLTVAAGDTVAITNGKFEVSIDNTSAASFGDGAALNVLKGSTLTVSGNPNNSGRNFCLNGDGSRLVIDGGSLKLSLTSTTYPFNSDSRNAEVLIVNGGLLSRVNLTGSMAGMYTRLSGTSNVLAVLDGGTLDSVTEVGTSDSNAPRTFAIVNAVGCRFAVTNATLKQRNTLRIGTATQRAVRNEVTFHDATVQFASGSGTQNKGRSLAFGSLALSNTVTVSGSAGSFGFDAVEIGGTNNLFDIASGTAAAFTTPVTLSGSGNTVRLSGCKHVSSGTWLPAFGGGTNMTLDVTGAFLKSSSPAFAISGTNAAIRVRNGGRLVLANAAAQGRSCLKFTPRATRNFTLSVEDGGLVILSNSVNMASLDGANGYNWTNCPNSSITFSGRDPKFRIDYSSVYQTIVLGTEDEKPLPDAVALVFEIPPEGWVEAPMQSLAASNANQEFVLYGNQPIVVRESEALAAAKHGRMRVPLIHDVKGFCSGTGNAHSRKAPLDAARVAKLNASATLPEGASLRYDEDAKTLCVELPSFPSGMVIYVR